MRCYRRGRSGPAQRTRHGAAHAVRQPHHRMRPVADRADAVQRAGHARAVVRAEQPRRQRLYALCPEDAPA
jgi:hypothetical protein